MRKLYLITVVSLLFLGCLSFTIPVWGADVTLAWDANSETDLAGYRVFFKNYGQAYDYAVPLWEGAETTCTVEIAQTGDFVVRAFNIAGQESGDSNEVAQSIAPANPQNLLKEAVDLAIKSLEKFSEYLSMTVNVPTE